MGKMRHLTLVAAEGDLRQQVVDQLVKANRHFRPPVPFLCGDVCKRVRESLGHGRRGALEGRTWAGGGRSRIGGVFVFLQLQKGGGGFQQSPQLAQRQALPQHGAGVRHHRTSLPWAVFSLPVNSSVACRRYLVYHCSHCDFTIQSAHAAGSFNHTNEYGSLLSTIITHHHGIYITFRLVHIQSRLWMHIC